MPDQAVLRDLGVTLKTKFYRGKGCFKCKQTGYLGRVGIFELLIVNEEIRKMIDEKASADQIREKAVKAGMKSLKDDGIEKIGSGITTIEEVLRVTRTE